MGSVQVLKTFAKEGLEKCIILANFFCTLHVTNTYLLTPAYLTGPSMLPTFHLTGNLVFAERISQRFGKIGAGDIVLVRSPENPRKSLTKRVRAMEGDEVIYLVDPQHSDKQDTITVPKGHVWIEGDNTRDSRDSKNFGPVPYGLIQGKIFWRVNLHRHGYLADGLSDYRSFSKKKCVNRLMKCVLMLNPSCV